MERSFPFRLKDGRPATIRPARSRDARASLEIVREAIAERPRTLAVLEDELWSPREWRRHRMSWTPKGVWLVAEVDGKVRGQLTCDRGSRPTLRHTAEFGIIVAADARGLGIGRALLQGLERWAIETGVTRISLGVFTGNDRAHALYESLGYVEEGIERRVVRFPEADQDVIRMAKYLDDHRATSERHDASRTGEGG